MHPSLLRTLAWLAPALVCATLALFFAGVDERWSWGATFLTLTAIGWLLASALSLSLRPVAGIDTRDRHLMQAHVVAHCVPLGFGLDALSTPATEALSTSWILAFALFFYTGRRTWRALQAARRSPVYFVFLRGNTAMLLSSVAMAVLAATIAPGLRAALEHIYLAYTAVHMILLGPAAAKIHRDLADREASPP